MRAGIRQVLSGVAIVAIALHAVLWGAGTLQAASPVDPFSIICHSGTAGTADETPTDPKSTPSHACDHCNLCGASVAPAIPDPALAEVLAPTRLVQVLRPASAAPRKHLSTAHKLPRGPPYFA